MAWKPTLASNMAIRAAKPLLGEVKIIPLKPPKTDVNPLIKTLRWSALAYGIYWGQKRNRQIQKYVAMDVEKNEEIFDYNLSKYAEALLIIDKNARTSTIEIVMGLKREQSE